MLTKISKNATERDVLIKIVLPFISRELGFDIIDDCEYEVSIESGRIDVLCYLSDLPILIIEVKSPRVPLFYYSRNYKTLKMDVISRTNERVKEQLLRYSNELNPPFAILMNGKQIVIYDVDKKIWTYKKFDELKQEDYENFMKKSLTKKYLREGAKKWNKKS